jgi:hypothetical protein
MVGKGFAKGFGERQGRGSLASHLRFACEIGAVLGVFSHDRVRIERDSVSWIRGYGLAISIATLCSHTRKRRTTSARE